MRAIEWPLVLLLLSACERAESAPSAAAGGPVRPTAGAAGAAGVVAATAAFVVPRDGEPQARARSSGEPVLPRVRLNTEMPTVSGRTWRVPAGEDLQRAIDRAEPGDEIVLEAGATYVGAFRLPAKGERPGWIVIRSDGALPAPGTRVTPEDADELATLVSSEPGRPILRTEAGAHHYRLVGIEIALAPDQARVSDMVLLGDGSRRQNSLASVPHHLVLDRVYIHGRADTEVKRCVALNSGATAIIDSWLSECHGKGYDSQAIGGWNGPGPYSIVNNHLAGAGENLMFGGADPAIPELIPSDVEILRNHFFKPPAWRGRWTVKNLLELKAAQRVLIEGNVLENSWADAQIGFAVVLYSVNQSGRCTWCVVQDVTFRYNVVRNTAAGFQLTDRGGRRNAIPMRRVAITHTLAEGVGAPSAGRGGRRMYQIVGGIHDLRLEHNTTVLAGRAGSGLMFGSSSVVPLDGLVIRNNILGAGAYPIFSSFGANGAALREFGGEGSRFEGNVVVGVRTRDLPDENVGVPSVAQLGFISMESDLRLRDDSPVRRSGAGGAMPGVDMAELLARVRGVAPDLP